MILILKKVIFYSDSHEDIELLDYVGNPRPLNPNKQLKAIAKERFWPIREFHSRGSAGVMDYARAVATQGSLVGSFFAGIPIYALTGSKRKAINFAISLFADTSTALTGMDLDIHGEKTFMVTSACCVHL